MEWKKGSVLVVVLALCMIKLFLVFIAQYTATTSPPINGRLLPFLPFLPTLPLRAPLSLLCTMLHHLLVNASSYYVTIDTHSRFNRELGP